MIYHIYWSNIRYKTRVLYDWTKNPPVRDTHLCLPVLTSLIRTSKDNSFVFILTNEQLASFDNWIKEKKLDDNEVYRMPRPVTNPNHPSYGRNLTLIVLISTKHFWRTWYED